MAIDEKIHDLSDEDVKFTLNVLGEPLVEKGVINRVSQNQKYQVINYLEIALGDDKEVNAFLWGIRVLEELKRIRNGFVCSSALPKDYVKTIDESFGKWGVLSFYRGRWEIKNPNLDENLPLITIRHVYTGSEILKNKLRGDLNSEVRDEIKKRSSSIKKTYQEMV